MNAKPLLIVCMLTLVGCNFFNNKKTISNPQYNSPEQNLSKTIKKDKSIDLDQRYIGAWKLVGMIPEISKNDASMEGIICEIEKYPNTKESYLFHLFTGHQLILSVENSNYLKGQNADMNVRYKEDLSELHLSIPKGSTWIFRKLK